MWGSGTYDDRSGRSALLLQKAGVSGFLLYGRTSGKTGRGKTGRLFEGLKQGKPAYTTEWEQYITYLAIAINNIHMVLDCDVVLGGYVGSYLEEYIREIRQKVSARSTFLEDGSYVHPCQYKTGAAALGAAQYVIETFVEQI